MQQTAISTNWAERSDTHAPSTSVETLQTDAGQINRGLQGEGDVAGEEVKPFPD